MNESQARVQAAGLDQPRRVELYRHMLRLRLLDRRMLNLQRQGRIGFYGPVTGQEAAVVGSAGVLEPHDWVFPALREAGVALMRGLPLVLLVRQLMGRGGEVTRGRQMPCHPTHRAGNYVSMSSVIGTQISQAAGVAMAVRLRGDSTVVVGYLGEGATSANDFHAGLNFAAVRRAPVVFFCQNNHWAISMPFSRQTASDSVAAKAAAYGMPSARIDGNDLEAVAGATRAAVERARGGGGPSLIEALTYRLLGHSSSDDPTRYRNDAEVEAWRARDPLVRERKHLEDVGLWGAAREEEAQDVIMAEISAAIEDAEKAPFAAVSSLFDDVFAMRPPELEEQRRELEEILRASSRERLPWGRTSNSRSSPPARGGTGLHEATGASRPAGTTHSARTNRGKR